MKKLLVALLIACFVFTVAASAAELNTKAVKLFDQLDFGTQSKAAKAGHTSDDYLRELIAAEATSAGYVTNFSNVDVESTADTWIITALKDGVYALNTMGEYWSNPATAGFDADYATKYAEYAGVVRYGVNNNYLMFNDLSEFDEIYEDYTMVRLGWGGWNGMPLYSGNYFAKDANGDYVAYGGNHQFVKFRLKNNSANTKIGFWFQWAGSYASTQCATFNITANDSAFKSYVFDMATAAQLGQGSGYGARGWSISEYCTSRGNNWIWQNGSGNATGTQLRGFLFYILGNRTVVDASADGNSYKAESYKPASLATYGTPDAVAAATLDGYYGRGLDTRYTIKAGDTVELDYMIFANTFEEAASYTSLLEDATETTGYLLWYNNYVAQKSAEVLQSLKNVYEQTGTETGPGTADNAASIIIPLSVMALAAVAAIVIVKKRAK